MTTANDQGQDAGVVAYVLRALVAGAVGALAGVALELGTHLTGSLAGVVIGGAVGFGLASGLYVATAFRSIDRLQNRIDELETRDALTGLPNGRALRTWLDRHLPHANLVQSHTALLVIHADGIDRINESHGREIGDELLKALVARVRGGAKRLILAGGRIAITRLLLRRQR